MTEKIFKEGPGWRLGFDPTAPLYPFLIGGNDWAVELTQTEFDDFQRLSRELRQTVTAIAPQLMAEEMISCEVESEGLWMEIEGDVRAYELRFILRQGRRAEGQWAAVVVAEFFIALDQITLV